MSPRCWKAVRFGAAVCLLLQATPSLAAPGAVSVGAVTRVLEHLGQEFADPIDPAYFYRCFETGAARQLASFGKDASAVWQCDLSQPEGRARCLATLADFASGLPAAQHDAVLLEGVREALTGCDDPGARLYGPGMYQKSLEELGYSTGGVGFFVDEDPGAQGLYTIVQMMEGFPAQKQGIKSGDKLLAVSGKSVRGMRFPEVASLIRGDVGTTVDVDIRSGSGATRKFTLTREWLNPNPKAIQATLEEKSVALLRFKYLGVRDDLDVLRQWDELQKQGARAVVLDLRNCPGDLQAAVPLLSLFLPEGSVAYQVQSHAGTTAVRTTAVARRLDVPVAVLINEYSGEAAAVVGGALSAHGRALLFGQPTLLKETRAYHWVAEELGGGNVATVTVNRTLLASGQPLWHSPLRPDLQVQSGDPAAAATGLSDDKALLKAIQFLRKAR